MLERLKVILDIKDGQEDNKLSVLLSMAEDKILDIIGRDMLPERLQSVCVEIAVIMYNRQGTEGSSSRSEGGISENYIDGLPMDIMKRLENYPKKIRVIRDATENKTAE
jgi:hypothetical protein